MTSSIMFLDDEVQSKHCRWFGAEESGRCRKRRRPLHEHMEKCFPLLSREHSLRRQKSQKTKALKPRHYVGRHRHSHSLFLRILLVFVCCQKYQSSLPSVLAVRARQTSKHNADIIQQQQNRFLQKEGKPKIDYLTLPVSLWTSKGSRDQFLGGNAIKISPFDKDILYATNRAGDLRILSASNGKSIDTVSPSPRTLTEDGTTTTWSLYSTSGMAFGSYPGEVEVEGSGPGSEIGKSDENQGYNDYLEFLLNNGIKQNEETRQPHFVVYSIIDEAPVVSRFLPKTRVVCVSIPEHKILWTSAGLPGTPNGSPLVYYANDVTPSHNNQQGGKKDSDNNGTRGMYIVLTHNSILIRPDNTTRTTGHLTVLDPSNGHVKWTQSEWSRDEIPKGYGPPQVSHSPILGGGNTGGSFHNKNDVIIWTSSDQQGRGRVGNLYSFQMKSPSELETEMKEMNSTDDGQNDQFAIRVLKRVRWNSIARPTMNRNGTDLFVGVTGNAIRGWNGIAKFNETANWSTRLVPFADEPDSSSQTYSEDVAISTAPVLSTDEKRLFVISARNETICLDTRTGFRMWTAKTRNPSPLLGEPKASPDNERLYVIMSEDGKVNGINQLNGKVAWSFGCDEKNLPPGSKCITPTVSADFDLSRDGTILYYGASDGRIVALTLGYKIGNEFDEKPPSISTSTSTISIEYDEDDRGPMEFDRKSGGTYENILGRNNNNQKFGIKIAGTVFAIILSLAIAAVSVIYVMRAKGVDWRNYRLPRHRSSKHGGGKRHSFVARVGRGMFRTDDGDIIQNSDGPDVYEDRIIASLSEDEESVEQQFNTLWVDPTHSNPKPIINDNESPTADRLAVLLGTSNRIAPIKENFGFGQAVLI